MTQKDRIANAQEFREKYFSPERKMWEMCIDYLSRYGSISAEEARIAYGDKGLSTTVWYCRKKGYYIKTAKNPANLKSYATFILGDEEQRKREEAMPKYTHASHPRLWKVWSSMRGRCYDPKTDSYPRYGGRGIKVCDEWVADFQAFAEWAIENGYDNEASFGECTIDRIDGDGDYEPSNCRWVDMIQQQNNRSNNVLIDYQGETHTIAEWSRLTGISRDSIRRRLISGWSVEETLTLARRAKCQHITFMGATKSISEWSNELHISADTIRKRLDLGWSIEDTLTKPMRKQKNNRHFLTE